MNKTNQNQVDWVEVKSPKGKFHLFRRHISLSLGAKKDVGTWGGGQPFDVEMTRIPPGATNWPYHAHAAQWELYIILDGRGVIRTPEGESEISPGDSVVCPPGEPHLIRNSGTEDLVYYVIADNPALEIGRYPDSDKFIVKQYLNGKFLRNVFKVSDADYYEGEE
jgi:uncharacterized cupin superfamily protein